jgi:formylglycine-generating enzyme
LLALLVSLAVAGCDDRKRGLVVEVGDAGAAVPEAGAVVPEPSASAAEAPSASAPSPAGPAPLVCPTGMLAIPGDDGVGKYCIDRWEASLIDRATGLPLSPYYPPHGRLAKRLHDQWERERSTVGGLKAQAMGVPALPPHQRAGDPEIVATSKPGVVPSGYMSGLDAERACRNAGKRLCRHEEWLQACKGQQRRQFPYGDAYKQGACNIFRFKHPAAELHDNPSIGHLDPRLNLVMEGGDPLLRKTGATPSCASQWGDEALFDMNGNLDEWIDEPKGRFVGGFFSRSKKDGCLSSVGAHPRDYFDYSTGTRCCLSPELGGPGSLAAPGRRSRGREAADNALRATRTRVAPGGISTPAVTITLACGLTAFMAGSMTPRVVSVAPGQPAHTPERWSLTSSASAVTK